MRFSLSLLAYPWDPKGNHQRSPIAREEARALAKCFELFKLEQLIKLSKRPFPRLDEASLKLSPSSLKLHKRCTLWSILLMLHLGVVSWSGRQSRQRPRRSTLPPGRKALCLCVIGLTALQLRRPIRIPCALTRSTLQTHHRPAVPRYLPLAWNRNGINKGGRPPRQHHAQSTTPALSSSATTTAR